MTTPVNRRGLVAAIAAVTAFAFGLSLSVPLIAIALERMGATGFEIGLNGAATALAIVIGGMVLPRVLRVIPAPQLILASVLGMAALLCLFMALPDIWVWLVLRMIFGCLAAAIFFGSEIWIIAAAPPERRGFWIGIYALCLSAGFLVGPGVLKLTGTAGWTPFLTGAALMLLAVGPLLWGWRAGPEMEAEGAPASPFAVFRYVRTDPSLIGAAFVFGCIEFGGMGLVPVWSLKVGMDEQAALTLVALLAAGNLVMQVPLGWLSDRWDRGWLLSGAATLSLGAALLAPMLALTTWPLWLVTAFWGGVVVGLYTFSLNELGSRYQGAAFARANGAFLAAYGMGGLLAPPALGAAMDVWPPHGMFYLLAAISAAYALLSAARRLRRA